ncbi:Gfo/Idh/MocA family oxidoreductase [bacterium]|nr:Gfo/Idh/MocA family oxidoreductase [bacterium]
MIRIGVIGAGPNGTGNAKRLAEDAKRCRISAVADPNPEAAKAFADAFGARAFGDFTAFLDEVDAVVISSPNFLHAAQAVACAKAGKHLFIEKPMALSIADAERIASAIDDNNVKSFVGFSVRFDPAIWKMGELFRAGAVGTAVTLWSRRMSFSGGAARKSWRNEYDKSGGLVTELLAHEIDWIINLAGMPKAVFCRKASRVHNDPRDNEHLWLTMCFDGETTGTIEGSAMSVVPDYYRGVVGTNGGMCTADWGRKLMLYTAKDKHEEVAPLEGFNKHAHFLDVLEGRTASCADARCGLNVVRVSEKAIESAVSGTVVTL